MQIDSEAVRREQQEALARVSAAVIAAQEILAGGTLESGKRKASMQVTDKPAKRARIFGLEELSDSETDSEDDEEIAMFEKAGQLAAAGSSGLDSSASDYEAAPSLRQTSPVGTSAAKTVLSDPHMAEPLHEPQPGKTAAFPLLDKANAPQHSAQPLLSGVASPHTTAASPSQATVLQSANAAQHAESPLTPASTSSPSMAQEAHGDISTGAEKQATVATAPVKAQAASAPADSIHQQHTVAVTASGTSAAGKSAASKASQQQEPIDLANFDNAAQLEGVGMERLKAELQRHGMKCGGTVQERASRLLLLKEKSVQDIDRKHLAKQ